EYDSRSAFFFAILLFPLARPPAPPPPLSADDTEPTPPTPRRAAFLDTVVVSAARLEQPLANVAADVTVLDREDVDHSAAQTSDDLLQQIPGFNLFRRSSSLVAHPTTQGVSLRGIGSSGASRTLVLLDGIPLNDPFGGWGYWWRGTPV